MTTRVASQLGLELRSYSAVNAAVLKLGAVVAYRVWLVGRALDRAGSGSAPLDQLLAAFQIYDLTRFDLLHGMDSEHAGIFVAGVDERCGVVYLRSLAAVCRGLGITDPGSIEPVPGAALTRIRKLKAALYAGWVRGAGQRLDTGAIRLFMGRERIEAITGCCPNTQKAYERLAHLKVQTNIVRVEPTNLARAARHMPRRKLPQEDTEITFTRRDDPDATLYQTVNTYVTPPATPQPTGNTRKVRRTLQRQADPVDRGDGQKPGKAQRVFFTLADLPDRHQNIPGDCLRSDAVVAALVTRRGRHNVFQFSGLRPVTRREAGIL